MTVVEISLLPFPLFYYDSALTETVYALFSRFIDSNPQLHGTMIASINARRTLRPRTPKNVANTKSDLFASLRFR